MVSCAERRYSKKPEVIFFVRNENELIGINKNISGNRMILDNNAKMKFWNQVDGDITQADLPENARKLEDLYGGWWAHFKEDLFTDEEKWVQR
jgi:hypothetical protein